MKNENKIWFKRKSYGWGWTPSVWQGWTIFALWVAFLVWQFRQIDALSHSASDTLIGMTIPFIASTIVLIGICYWKGESPRWQWGE